MKKLLKSVAQTTQSLPVAQALATADLDDVWRSAINQNYMSFDTWTQTIKALRDNPKVEVFLIKGSQTFRCEGELIIRPRPISKICYPIVTPLTAEEYKRLYNVLHPPSPRTFLQKLKALL